MDSATRLAAVLAVVGVLGAITSAVVWAMSSNAHSGTIALTQFAAAVSTGLFGVFGFIELWWMVCALLLLRHVGAKCAGSVVLLGARMYDINSAIDATPGVESIARIGSFFVISADREQIDVWNGPFRPQRVLTIRWESIKQVRVEDRIGWGRRAVGLALKIEGADTRPLLFPIAPVRPMGVFISVSDQELALAKSAIEMARR